jgi:galactose oxidase
MISGLDPSGAPTDTIEVIDFADTDPRWRPAGKLAYPLTTRKAVVLPDGKVLLGHGLNRGLASVGDPVVDYERREGLRFHLYDPDTFAVTPLARTTVSRGLHGTATLLPDASVFFAGENREALVRNNDPSFPLMSSYAGLLPAGDPDQAVPVGQIFYPAYLFRDGGNRAARPVVTESPDKISFRGHFDITVAGDAREIASVALLRSDHNTHSFTGGDRHVKLAFELKDDDDRDDDDRRRGDDKRGRDDRQRLRVTAPVNPAQAVPGIYMLFVVDVNGVPSVAKQVRIEPDTRGATTRFR